MRTEVHFTKFEAVGATCRATKKKAHPEPTPLMSQTYQSLPWRIPLNQPAAAPIKTLAIKARGRKVIQRSDVITISPRKREENGLRNGSRLSCGRPARRRKNSGRQSAPAWAPTLRLP